MIPRKRANENIVYAAATEMGQVMRATGVGEVIESNAAGLEIGDRVLGGLGWQDVADVRGRTLSASG